MIKYKENNMKTYSMKCYECNTEMVYVPNKIEQLGYIHMFCPKCDEGYLVPEQNPNLHTISVCEEF